MPEYKLVYFNARGRAEIIRWVFTAAGVPFVDFRIMDREKWPDMKPSMPFGQVPVLEIDGKEKLGQSLTISRYIARQHGVAGGSPLEQAKVDFAVDCIEDLLKLMSAFNPRNPRSDEEKAESKKKYVEEQLPLFLEKMEKLLTANKGGSGYLVGDGLTWADLYLGVAMQHNQLTFSIEPNFGKAPKLKALFDKVLALPKIAAYLAKREKTPS